MELYNINSFKFGRGFMHGGYIVYRPLIHHTAICLPLTVVNITEDIYIPVRR